MLNKCLGAVLQQVDEVIITREEGGSHLPSDVIWYPKIKHVVVAGTAIGFGANVNGGAKHATGDWLLILNDDMFLMPYAVPMMLKATDDKTGIVGHLQRYPEGYIYHGGKERNTDGTVGYKHIDYGKRFPTIETVTEMENVCGSSMLVHRQSFETIGGFDEGYLFYNDDDDLCMRIRQIGLKVMYTPFAVGIHDHHQERNNAPFNWREILVASRQLFGQRWKKYFEHNRRNKLGNFDYE